MSLLSVIGNIISRIPFERIIPPPDHAKSLEKFASTMTAPTAQKEAPPEENPTTTTTQEPETVLKQETVATACVNCTLGHFAVTAGLLNEAVRFKAEGITSNEVADRIAKSLQELNALERVDLTPEKIRSAPDWERDIAEEALLQSRALRHRLETIKTIEDLEQAAADTAGYYRRLNREWWKRRVEEPKLTLEEAKQMAANIAVKKVEESWPKEE